ncbi:hypothetical protein I2F30_13260, partial [Acinetobacter sp. SCC474]|nr:hypothetical protein [Acinetobacter pollinis]
TGSENSAIDRERGQDRATELYRQEEPQTPMYSNEQGRRDMGQRSNGSNGLLEQIKQNLDQADQHLSHQQAQNIRENLANDRFRKGINQGIGADESGTQRGTNRLASDVREYQRRESETQTGFKQLCTTAERNRADEKKSLEQINQASHQLDRAITTARNTTFEAQKMNQCSRSYSIKM